MENERRTVIPRRWRAAAAVLLAVSLLLLGWALHRRKTVLNLDRLAGYLLRHPPYSDGMRALG